MIPPSLAIFLMAWIAFAAWISLTFGSIAVALAFWAVAARMRHGWIAHFVFVRVVLGLDWLLVRVMFWGARDDGEGPPGLGMAIIPAIGILIVTTAVYYVRLTVIGTDAAIKAFKAARTGAIR